MGTAMCAVRGDDTTGTFILFFVNKCVNVAIGVSLKVLFPLYDPITMGMQAGMAPEVPAVQAFFNESSSFSTNLQQKIYVAAGYGVLGAVSRDPTFPRCQATFLFGSTPSA